MAVSSAESTNGLFLWTAFVSRMYERATIEMGEDKKLIHLPKEAPQEATHA